MNRILLSLTLALTTLSVVTGVAHAELLTYFNFNDAPATTAGAGTSANNALLFSPDGGTRGTAITSNFTVTNVNSFGGTALNSIDDVAGQALALRGGPGTENNSKFIQFGVNTTGFKDTKITFSTLKTNSGFNSNQFSYSIGGGGVGTFTNFGPTYNPLTEFGLQTFDLSSLDTLDDQSLVYFRLTFNGATNAGGNNRIDNIQVNAVSTAAVPEPSTIALFSIGLASLGAMRRRKKQAESENSSEPI